MASQTTGGPQDFPRYEDFEDAFVAFIDILGFTERVLQIQTRDDFLNVARVLYVLKREAESYTDSQGRFVDQVQASAVSDSVIVSIPYRNEVAATLIVALLHQLQYELLADSGRTLIRGYLARGPVYHRRGILFGAGYLAAYRGESSTQGPPRIVLDPALAAQAVEVTERARGDGRASVLDWLKQDSCDGMYFIDYLKPLGARAERPLVERRQEIVEIAAFARAEIPRHANPRIQEKYHWLVNYVDASQREHY